MEMEGVMRTTQPTVEIFPDTIPQKNEAILDRVLDGETVLFNLSTNKLHSLNETASYIWQQCDGTNSVSSLVVLLKRSFAVKAEQAEADLCALLEGMYHAGLIEL
jgi:hypothetical protein